MKKKSNTLTPPLPAETRVERKKLTMEEFVLLAVDKLRDPKYKTIHVVYSGFNDAFRDYFPGSDPVAEVKRLEVEGKISYRMCRGGAIIGLPGAVSKQQSKNEALKKMGI